MMAAQINAGKFRFYYDWSLRTWFEATPRGVEPRPGRFADPVGVEDSFR